MLLLFVQLPATSIQTPAACSRSFFFNDTATTEIYTLSLHDALPISWKLIPGSRAAASNAHLCLNPPIWLKNSDCRSEEHTSELQSRPQLVCRLLLEKKNNREERRPAVVDQQRLPTYTVVEVSPLRKL